MRRNNLLHSSGVLLLAAALNAFPAPAQAEIDFESSMTAHCVAADCSQVTFVLNLNSGAYVDFVRIFSFDDSLWTFDSLAAITDASGNSVNWASDVFQHELVLKAGGSFAPEPLYITVNMRTHSNEADLGGNLGYTGSADSSPSTFGDGSAGDFQGTVTPEPISMVLLGTGMLGIAGARRRKRSEFGEDEEV